MKFWLDGLEVYFPYAYIYPEQYQYMYHLKKALDATGPCVLEMPSGTGKTIALLALITSYQLAHPEVGKLVYCSRTVPEVEKVVEELRRLLAYREAEMGGLAPKTLCLSLSSRRNLCIHPRVSELKDSSSVDSACRSLTASWVRERSKQDPQVETCAFFEGFDQQGVDALLTGVYSLDDLREFGRQKGWCPYFLARHLVNFATVVVFSYQYVLDPKVASMVTAEFKKDSIVVFDEAHNIDNVCIDALSLNLNRRLLEASTRNLTKLSSQVAAVKATDTARLQREYMRLVDGLAQSGLASLADQTGGEPVLPADVLKEAVPGNIRRAEHFIGLLRRWLEYLKRRLRAPQVVSESPLAFLQSVYTSTQIEPRVLRFTSARLGSLLRTLEISEIDEFSPLCVVADLATLASTYAKGFVVLIEPYGLDHKPAAASTATGGEAVAPFDPVLQFCCLDASLAMKPVVDKFRSVVITSGTLSPLDMYPRILNFRPVLTERFPMSLTRACICPLVVTRGSDQVAVSTKYDVRNDLAVVRNYGNLLIELSAIVPDGIVCFFPSYRYLESIVTAWHESGLLGQVLQRKLLFVETPDILETTLALENYRRACDSGRGAVLLSVARGKVSEGIDFDHHYGRAVVMFGLPYLNTESRVLRARLEYLRDQYQIKENEFLAFDAMRTTAQCVGRVIRGKTDYSVMVFADKRFNRLDKRTKLPQWISNFLTESHLNLSTDMAVGIAKRFLREMAQPWRKEDQLGVALWSEEDVKKQPLSAPPPQRVAGPIYGPAAVPPTPPTPAAQ